MARARRQKASPLALLAFLSSPQPVICNKATLIIPIRDRPPQRRTKRYLFSSPLPLSFRAQRGTCCSGPRGPTSRSLARRGGLGMTKKDWPSLLVSVGILFMQRSFNGRCFESASAWHPVVVMLPLHNTETTEQKRKRTEENPSSCCSVCFGSSSVHSVFTRSKLYN